ncbi:MAG: branched-chain amino acid transporter permease [Firmicutes bacterium]|nr:branched-chain amino acid transporter permease [Bacillota bacterium]
MEEGLRILPQILISGLVIGFLYAVVALGYTMVYGVLEFINFAHSEIFMFGAFIGFEVLMFLQKTSLLTTLPMVISLILTMLAAMIFSGALGWTVERLAYRPLRGAPRLVPLISAIGVSFFLQDAARIIWEALRGNWQLAVPPLYTGVLTMGPWQVAGAPLQLQVPYGAIVIMVSGLIMMFSLIWFVNKTKVGKAMRAVAQDRSTAALMGVNVDRIISTTFVIGGALGGAAGSLFAIRYTSITPYIGFILGVKAFTAAVFGGIGNLAGAVIGGLLLGIFEALGTAYLGPLTHGALKGPEYKDIFAFLILILVLVFKPAGLLGRTVGEKV